MESRNTERRTSLESTAWPLQGPTAGADIPEARALLNERQTQITQPLKALAASYLLWDELLLLLPSCAASQGPAVACLSGAKRLPGRGAEQGRAPAGSHCPAVLP